MKIFTHSTLTGTFLIFISIAMELFGLFSQYYLGLEPCTNCVQVRFFILFIGLAGLLHLLSNDNILIKISTLLLAAAATILSLLLSWDNLLIEAGKKIATCGNHSAFPRFFPLDLWLPQIFEPRGPCGTAAMLYGDISFIDLTVFGLSSLLILIFVSLLSNLHYIKENKQ